MDRTYQDEMLRILTIVLTGTEEHMSESTLERMDVIEEEIVSLFGTACQHLIKRRDATFERTVKSFVCARILKECLETDQSIH